MHPVILSIGPLEIKAYGLMLAIAFWIAILIAPRELRRKGIDSEVVPSISLIVIISSLVGGRVAFVLSHLAEYRRAPLDILKVWEGGLTFYGGFLLAVVVGLAYLRRKRVPLLRFCDAVTPALALGEGITRIGCFVNGCCFGVPTTLPWSVVFPKGSYADYQFGQVAVHPSQLYSSGAGFLIFILVILLRRRVKRDGSLFMCLVFLDSCARILIDCTRFYEVGSNFGRMIPYALLVVSAAFLVQGFLRRERGAAVTVPETEQ
ncbi:MAG: prolipoprotein diacylglyceryl transferase [Candidatus Eisenbacteria bacterium]|nr:prolipoprotein diacylglyceryl transferase [Candidatus Eisenbacteria bacterium]